MDGPAATYTCAVSLSSANQTRKCYRFNVVRNIVNIDSGILDVFGNKFWRKEIETGLFNTLKINMSLNFIKNSVRTVQ